MTDSLELADRAITFRAAHHVGTPVLLPNVWDVVSAKAVEAAGFKYLATSSSAIAKSVGGIDANCLDPLIVFGIIAKIAAAAPLPVSADIEGGYGLTPERLAEELVAAGAIGCNIEDKDHRGPALLPLAYQANRIARLRRASDALGVGLVINARVDSVSRRVGTPAEQIADVIRRGRAYLDAGADCIYPIMLADEEGIAAVVAVLDAPINVNLRAGGPSLAQLVKLGVARISYASALFRFMERTLTEVTTKLHQFPDAIL